MHFGKAVGSQKTLATVFLKSVRGHNLKPKGLLFRSLNLSFAPTTGDALIPI
jgi:hypothetical protein